MFANSCLSLMLECAAVLRFMQVRVQSWQISKIFAKRLHEEYSFVDNKHEIVQISICTIFGIICNCGECFLRISRIVVKIFPYLSCDISRIYSFVCYSLFEWKNNVKYPQLIYIKAVGSRWLRSINILLRSSTTNFSSYIGLHRSYVKFV